MPSKYEKFTCQFKNKTNLKIYFSRMNNMAPEESSCNYNNASKINREFKHRPREQQKANKQNYNFARASIFFIHFLTVVARLQRGSA